MNTTITAKAQAAATVANQPGFDQGGFPIHVLELIAGESPAWETLNDLVEISLNYEEELNERNNLNINIEIQNNVPELNEKGNKGLTPLPNVPEEHTAGKILLELLEYFEPDLLGQKINNISLLVNVTKGISIKGTGLGSSGATPPATLAAFIALMKQLNISTERLSDLQKAQLLQRSDFGVPDNSIPAYFGGLNLISLDERNHVREVEQITTPEQWLCVLVTPKNFGIETQKAREVLAGINIPDDNQAFIQTAVGKLKDGKTKEYAQLVEKIHTWFVGERVDSSGKRNRRSSLYPDKGKLYSQVEEAAKAAGAWGVSISGAGPTMIAFVPEIESGLQIGQAMYDAFLDNGCSAVARLCTVDPNGAELIN